MWLSVTAGAARNHTHSTQHTAPSSQHPRLASPAKRTVAREGHRKHLRQVLSRGRNHAPIGHESTETWNAEDDVGSSKVRLKPRELLGHLPHRYVVANVVEAVRILADDVVFLLFELCLNDHFSVEEALLPDAHVRLFGEGL